MDSIFDDKNNITLANKFRPSTLTEVFGQSHLTDKYKVLSAMVYRKKPFSILLFGPTSSGKTSIAIALCNDLQKKYILFNAAIGDKKELVSGIEKCISNGLILIIDEIHRLNKNIIEYLLPSLESGTLIIFGLTTENIYFAIPPAIRSRCYCGEVKPLTLENVKEALNYNLKKYSINISEDCINDIAAKCAGDLRSGINMISLLLDITKDKDITKSLVNTVFPNGIINTESGDINYYDILSALHKSCRGSDVNGALYWLGKALVSNDLKSLTRRLICIVNEDIGLANESLVTQVMVGAQSALEIGMPECRLIYANLVIQICLSDKSNTTVKAIDSVIADLQNGKIFSPPAHLRDSHYKSAVKLGHGVDYKYPHDFPDHYVQQQYMPAEIEQTNYFIYDEKVCEENDKVKKWLARTKKTNI
ncbi:MAG: AAA family ATPase [Mycoplasmataceae bacterium]|jgi:putative ATPase|nr:AAA family ATPase [Mycoplasmataceae bacterium]